MRSCPEAMELNVHARFKSILGKSSCRGALARPRSWADVVRHQFGISGRSYFPDFDSKYLCLFRVQPCGVHVQYARHCLLVLWSLTCVGAPVILGRLVWTWYQADGKLLPTTNYFEMFAGRKAITHAMRYHGHVCLSYERDDDTVHQDLCSAEGFIYALKCVLSLEVGGGLWAAIVCSSWIRLSAGTSGRRVTQSTDMPFQTLSCKSTQCLCIWVWRLFWVPPKSP